MLLILVTFKIMAVFTKFIDKKKNGRVLVYSLIEVISTA